MKAVSLRTKILLGIVGVVLSLATLTGTFMYLEMSRVLYDELTREAISMARELTARLTEYVLTDSVFPLQRLVDSALENSAEMDYILVTDLRGRVLAHSFPSGIPKGLLEANSVAQGSSHRVQLIENKGRIVRDVAIPILEGSAGTVRVGVNDTRARRVITRTVNIFVGLTALVCALALVASYVFGTLMTRSLSELAEAAHAVGQGDLDRQVRVKKLDEVGEVGMVFNQMVTSLKQQRDELTQARDRLEEKVEERTGALRQAQAEVLQSEKLAAVGQLAAGVAHEISNPLGAILTLSKLLLKKTESGPPGLAPSVANEHLSTVRDEAERCGRVIHNLLDFARITPPAMGEVSLEDVVDKTLALVGHQARLQNVEIVKTVKPSLPTIVADPSQLQQVFVNVALNAIQAMPKGGRLTVELRAVQPDSVEVVFTDTGCGIAPENLDKVFDPFFTTKQVGQGTGLGLSVAYGIVSRHGGTIGVQSQVGQGTIVTVRLPVRQGKSG